MSWRPEVIADSTGKWCGNSLRFATREEAEQNVSDLAFRWTSVRETRVVESDDPVNYTYHDRQLRPVPIEETVRQLVDDMEKLKPGESLIKLGIRVMATRSNEVDPDQTEMPLDDK